MSEPIHLRVIETGSGIGRGTNSGKETWEKIPEGLQAPVHSQNAMQSRFSQPCPHLPSTMGSGQQGVSTAHAATGSCLTAKSGTS